MKYRIELDDRDRDELSRCDFLDFDLTYRIVLEDYTVLNGFKTCEEAKAAWALLGRTASLNDMTKVGKNKR